MLFGLFKQKDPICGMKEEKGKGINKDGEWFCTQSCAKKFEELKKSKKKGGCYGH
jgi:YHS domain-containing protein